MADRQDDGKFSGGVIATIVYLISGLSRHTHEKVQDGLENLVPVEFQRIYRSEAENQNFCGSGRSSDSSVVYNEGIDL